MNEQKILLVNLSKGKIGEENSSFLGAMFLTKIFLNVKIVNYLDQALSNVFLRERQKF
jgi:uncharacterized membrane protein